MAIAQPATLGATRVSRRVTWDATFVCLSLAHAALLLTMPSIPLVALGLWWSANTISHNFIHRPFFRSRRLNGIYSAYLSLVLGIPQRLWRSRHLSHHAGVPHRLRWSKPLIIEMTLIAGLWTLMAVVTPRVFLFIYLPGWLLGLGLCQLHGYYEHAHGTRSYYGRLYNLLFFNDGFHVEHHSRPADHWTMHGGSGRADERPSRWPPVLRWIEGPTSLLRSFGGPRRHGFLTALERMVLRSAWLQRFVLNAHEKAFRKLLPASSHPARVTVVGGGLFPRTALVLHRLMPSAHVTIVDANATHLAAARPFVGSNATFTEATFDASAACDTDLLVVPLAFDGDRHRLYDRPPARLVLVHDWLWSPRGRSVVISWLLLKRLDLIQQ